MNVKRKIKDFILNESEIEVNASDIEDDASLIELDILDSLFFLTLIAFINEEFDIFPNDDELYPENFETISAICNFISKKKIW